MDFKLVTDKNKFPLYVHEQLNQVPCDFLEKHLSIVGSNAGGSKHLEAGVVVLLHYKNGQYAFQFIKRSEAVVQAGDISFPGGILEEKTDQLLNHLLLETGFIRTIAHQTLNSLPGRDARTASLIQLFMMNALREAWEEIGLSPLNIWYLGALPSYSLTFFSRTIFPVVCVVREPYEFQLSLEVENVLEVPLTFFFQDSSYALLEIESAEGGSDSRYNMQFPALIIPDDHGHNEILWGATFNIVTNFLKILTGQSFPTVLPSRSLRKKLSAHYASGNHD